MKRANFIGLFWALLMTAAIALNVPTNAVQIKSLAGEKIAGVKLLGSEEKIEWHFHADALVIQPVTIWPSQFVVAWKIAVAKKN